MEHSVTAFKVKGKEYDVRVFKHDTGLTVQVYQKDKAIGPKYSVTCETAADFQRTVGTSAIDELVAIAKKDVELGIVDVP